MVLLEVEGGPDAYQRRRIDGDRRGGRKGIFHEFPKFVRFGERLGLQMLRISSPEACDAILKLSWVGSSGASPARVGFLDGGRASMARRFKVPPLDGCQLECFARVPASRWRVGRGRRRG